MGVPTAVDLFAGAGGFSLGFELGGFSLPLALEMDTWACDTLRFNHRYTQVIHDDIRHFDTETKIRSICTTKPDLVIGGPPCQGFSIAGPAQKDPKDPRNSLFVNFAQWVKVLEPKAFVMENVKGLLSRKNAEGQNVIDIIRRTFEGLGYFVEIWSLNAAEYGVPQIRERVFIVGHDQPKKIGPPVPTHTNKIDGTQNGNSATLLPSHSLKPAWTLWDAISDLPELNAGEGSEEQPYKSEPSTNYQRWARGSSEILCNHVAMEHTKRLVERFKYIRWGGSISDVPSEHSSRRRSGNGELSNTIYDQNNRRLHPYKPSHTIAAAFYANFVHPFQHRNLTAREGARVQSFPDTYRFLGKKTVVSHKLLHREERFSEKYLCQYNQIGNAVPPILAKVVALHLRKELSI